MSSTWAGRCQLACVLFLLGTGCASADGGWIDRLVGTWDNLATGESLIIGRGQLGLWEVWASNGGQGRITSEEGESPDKGANVALDSRAGGKCAYYLTIINQDQINMQLRNGADTCLHGVFARVVATPAPAHTRAGEKGLVTIFYRRRHWCDC